MRGLVFGLTCLLLAGCATARAQQIGTGPLTQAQDDRIPEGVELFVDMIYGQIDSDRPLHLDLARPIGAAGLPAVIYIHGGAWRSGTHHTGRTLELAEAGLVGISIEHRLSKEAIWPAQIHDCKAAVRWVRANAEALGVDGARIGVWGESSGGHLAALLATSGDEPALEGELGEPGVSSRVSCAVDTYGPADLVHFAVAGTIWEATPSGELPTSLLFGEDIESMPVGVVREADPINWVDPGDPPMLIQHGSADDVVPISQSDLLWGALRGAGVEVIFHRYEGEGHGFEAGAREAAHAEAIAFLREHLQAEPRQ